MDDDLDFSESYSDGLLYRLNIELEHILNIKLHFQTALYNLSLIIFYVSQAI